MAPYDNTMSDSGFTPMSFDATPDGGSNTLGGTPPVPQVQIPHMQEATAYQQMRHLSMLGRMGRMLGMNPPRSSGGYNSGRGMPGSYDMSTGVDPSLMDPERANALLAPFNQHMPTNPSPYAFLPNSGFFGNHTRIGGGIEGALFAAANTGPANTWGEGIQQVARGVLGGSAERSRAINQQYSQPFQQASMVGQLMHLSQQMELEKQHEALYKAQAEKDLKDPRPQYHLYPDTDPKSPTYGKMYRIPLAGGSAEIVPGQPDNTQFNKPLPSNSKPWGGVVPSRLYDIAGSMGIPTDRQPTQQESAAMHGQWLKEQGGLRAISANISTKSAEDREQYRVSFELAKQAYKSEYIDPKTPLGELYTMYKKPDGTVPSAEEIKTHNAGVATKYGLPESFDPNSTFEGLMQRTPGKSPLPSKSSVPHKKPLADY